MRNLFFVSCANAVRPYKFSLRLKHRIQKRFGLCGNPAFSFARKRRAPLSAFITFEAPHTETLRSMRNLFFVSCANAVRPYQLSLRLKQRIHKRSVYAETRLLVPHANAVRHYKLSLRLKHRIHKRFGLCGNPFFRFVRKRRAPLSAFIMLEATYT